MEAVWPWRAGATPTSGADEGRRRRKRALLQVAIMLTIGFLFYVFVKEHRYMAVIVWSLAGLVLIAALAAPQMFDALEKFGGVLKRVVGTGLTWFLLVPLFYTFFTVGRVSLMLSGKDPMQRGFEDCKDSFWLKYHHPADIKQYEKQH